MHLRHALTLLILSAVASAQTPPPCPADRPVDDIIAEVHSQQSKGKNRNANPFPNVTCIWNWCRDLSRTPTPDPEPQQAPSTEPPVSASGNSSGTSSSRNPKEDCDRAMERALEAGHNIEVGDYYFDQKNYRAALLRYQDALMEKPGDAAIHVRLGRALEKLKEPSRALEHYQAAGRLPAPERWLEEARAAIARLQQRK